MKKIVISFLVILTLLFSMSSASFADENDNKINQSQVQIPNDNGLYVGEVSSAVENTYEITLDENPVQQEPADTGLSIDESSHATDGNTNDEITVDQNQLKDLVNDGLTTDEAQFILQLDKKLKSSKNKIKINDQTPNISDQDVTKNVKSFRKRALEKEL